MPAVSATSGGFPRSCLLGRGVVFGSASLAWKHISAVALLCLLLVSCASNKAFVANQSAARIYQEDRYERLCVQQKGPGTCKDMQGILNTLERHEPKGCDVTSPTCKPVGLIPVANKVIQVGALPKQERAELKDLMSKLSKLP